MKMIATFFLLLCVTRCAPSNIADCQREAKGAMKSLIADLSEIQTREDLIEMGSTIQRDTEALVFLMIRMKKLQDKGETLLKEEDHAVSDLLMQEMKRIYRLEGGRELMESFQREALLKLDAFDQKRKK